MVALREGARHVTAVERWLYLALACKTSMQANGFNDDQCKVDGGDVGVVGVVV